jgi:DNA-binding PadR family transcriptional regulator
VTVEAHSGTQAMRSPLNWALLGLVIQRPSYGYELVQRFERTYEDALELSSPSQIYTALDALMRRSLIEEVAVSREPDGVVRQPKPHYRATPSGVSGYSEWLIAQAQDERRRSRLFARELAVLAPHQALAVIERYEQACLKRASCSGALLEDGSLEAAAGALAARLVCEEERLALDARLAWIEYARRELASLTPRPAPGQ